MCVCVFGVGRYFGYEAIKMNLLFSSYSNMLYLFCNHTSIYHVGIITNVPSDRISFIGSCIYYSSGFG